MVFDELQCQYCGEEFLESEHIFKHKASKHSLQHSNINLLSNKQIMESKIQVQSNLNIGSKLKKIKKIANKVQCDMCGYFGTQSDLSRHMNKSILMKSKPAKSTQMNKTQKNLLMI